MLKFTMNAKELKTMIDKGTAAINKKASLPALARLYFQVEADGTVKTLGTDHEHYAEISSNNAWNTSPGVFGIDVEDLKIITKMNDNVILEDISTESENKISVKCGKKVVTIPKYENIDIFLPSMDNTEEHVLTMNESWLLETITNLFIYTSDNDSNKMMQAFHFNTTYKRVEALDGYRIGMRTLENQKIEKEIANPFDNVLLHRKCMQVFKKIMDKKSDAEVKVYQDKKYIKVKGKDFTYIIRRVDGEYFKVNQMLTDDADYSFIADKENMLSVMKYDCDLVKDLKKPVVLHSEDGKLYTYLKTIRYEAFDNVETEGNTMDNDLYIGFNPHYLADAFSMVDTDNPVCRGKNNKSPLFIDGNEYKFLVLPVNIGEEVENMKECINRDRVA